VYVLPPELLGLLDDEEPEDEDPEEDPELDEPEPDEPELGGSEPLRGTAVCANPATGTARAIATTNARAICVELSIVVLLNSPQ
jgi:hypothetical protein